MSQLYAAFECKVTSHLSQIFQHEVSEDFLFAHTLLQTNCDGCAPPYYRPYHDHILLLVEVEPDETFESRLNSIHELCLQQFWEAEYRFEDSKPFDDLVKFYYVTDEKQKGHIQFKKLSSDVDLFSAITNCNFRRLVKIVVVFCKGRQVPVISKTRIFYWGLCYISEWMNKASNGFLSHAKFMNASATTCPLFIDVFL